jgi:hypothetical protein
MQVNVGPKLVNYQPRATVAGPRPELAVFERGFSFSRKEKTMTKIEPEIDPAIRVPDLPASGNRATRLIAIAVALIVLLALISQLMPGVLTVPGSSPLGPPPAPPVTTAP